MGAEGVRGGGRPGPIWINGEFVAVHASIMRLNETRRGAKWIQKFVCRACQACLPLTGFLSCFIFVFVFM